MITKWHRFNIVNKFVNGVSFEEILEQYKNINLNSTELHSIINKSHKCRTIKKNGIYYRKCIYCTHYKELNSDNFNRDKNRKFGFKGICKYHANLKKRNYRIINKKAYKKRHNEEQKKYYQKHKKKILEYRRNYYQKHKSKLNANRTIAKRKERQKKLEQKLAAARENIL